MTIPYYKRTADLSAGELVDLVYSLSYQLEEKFSVSDENREILSTFRTKVIKLIPFAERNDFQNILANGFRSYLRGICHMLYAVVERMSKPCDVQDFITVLTILNKWIDNPEDLEKNGDPIGYPPWDRKFGRRLLQDGIDEGLKCLRFFLKEPLVGMSYTNGFRFLHKFAIRFLSLFTTSSYMESLSLLFSHEKAVNSTTTFIQQHMSGYTLHNMTKVLVMSYKIFERVLGALHLKMVTNVNIKEVVENIPSPVEIAVISETGSVELRKRSQDVKFRHRYIIVRSKGEEFKGKVIFFVHGGGFVISPADLYNVFLSHLADAMPGVTIINVDISSSVHGRFPKIPQEVLDVYCRFFSQQVKNRPDMLPYPLDFDVKEVALVGDSSGGNLIASLVFQLNDWRTKLDRDHFDILMPRSIVPLYPKMFARPQADPGLLINSWSCMIFLNAYTLKAIMEIYCPFRRRNKNGNWSLLPNGERPPKEWMWMEEEIDIIDHPYISPGAYEDFESLKGVELHMLGLNFDGFIHEAVSFARLWKGEVNLVTIDGVPHGFNLFPIYDKSTRDSRDQIIKLVRGSLS